jgi:hypothetical protein
VRTPVTLRVLDEIERHRLRYTCDDCAYFLALPRPECSHRFPLGERRGRAIAVGDTIVFCKEFEL